MPKRPAIYFAAPSDSDSSSSSEDDDLGHGQGRRSRGRRGRSRGRTRAVRRRKASPVVRNPALDQYDDYERRYYRTVLSSDRRRIAEAETELLRRLKGGVHGVHGVTVGAGASSKEGGDQHQPERDEHQPERDEHQPEREDVDDGALMERPMRFRILLSGLDPRTKLKALRKLELAASCGPQGSEFAKTMGWLDAVCALPVGVYRALPVTGDSPIDEIGAFLDRVQAHLAQRVHGHAETKGHIVRLLARWITNPRAQGLVLGIHGEMGTGKTRLCQTVCQVLGLPFAFVPLGGSNDGCFLTGHSYTYEGAVWGRIADAVMKARCMNPVIFFDEVDKVSDTTRGQEIINTLIHLTDPTQNSAFNDKYFADIDLDLSRCLIIFSYNDERLVSPILRDRITCVKTAGYGLKDKQLIARDHLLPDVLDEYAMPRGSVVLPDEAVAHLVSFVAEEQGVRNLRRGIVDVVSNINLERLLGKRTCTADCPVTVDRDMVQRYVAKDSKRCPMSLSLQGIYS